MRLPHRRQFLHLAAGAAALPAVSQIAKAQAYPTRPITIVVPFATGGPPDTIARILADMMRASLGQPVIIENVTGAAGSIGVGRVARAPADGYTLSIGSVSSHVMTGAIYALGYDLLNDLTPVSLLTTYPLLIAGKKAIPANDLADLIAWLKANPDTASAGTGGVGSVAHLGGILFQQQTNTRFQFVPYRGTSSAMQDLVAGVIDLMFVSPIDALPQVQSGNIKAYAVTAKGRLVAAPDIPTSDEAGLAGLYVSVWNGLWVRKGTPNDAIAKINTAIVGALADARVRSRLADLGQEIFPPGQQTPEALRVLQKAEIEKWWPIIKELGIKAE
jgi:tripartite-type tricarboxylate transporter receptor subunit TctC